MRARDRADDVPAGHRAPGRVLAQRKPGLTWLPALMVPALLLLAFIDYTAWYAWWI